MVLAVVVFQMEIRKRRHQMDKILNITFGLGRSFRELEKNKIKNK